MPTTEVIVKLTFVETLKMLATRYSTWVVFVLSGTMSWWMQLPLETQSMILQALPLLKWFGPVVGFFLFLVARGLPQPKLTV